MATAQAPPEDLLPPLVELVSPTQVKVTAQTPGQPNGIILSYTLRLLETETTFEAKSPQEFLVDGTIMAILYFLYLMGLLNIESSSLGI